MNDLAYDKFLEQIAQRGEPRGARRVFEAAQAQNLTAAPSSATATTSPATVAARSVRNTDPADQRNRRRHRRGGAYAACAAVFVVAVVVAGLAMRAQGNGVSAVVSPATAPGANVDGGPAPTGTPSTSVAAGPNGEARAWNTTPVYLGLDLADARPLDATESPWVPYPQPPQVESKDHWEQLYAVGQDPPWNDADPTLLVMIDSKNIDRPLDGPVAPGAPNPYTPTSVNGSDAVLYTASNDMSGLAWRDGAHHRIEVRGLHLTTAELQSIAAGIGVRADGSATVPPLAHGLIALKHGGFHQSPLRGGANFIDYVVPNPNAQVRINVEQGDQQSFDALIDSTPGNTYLHRSVRGHDAIITRTKPLLGTTVAWYEPEHDAVISVSFVNGFDGRLDDVLNHLVEIDAATMQTVIDQTKAAAGTSTTMDIFGAVTTTNPQG